MAANIIKAGELERSEEISVGGPIQTLESALRRALSTSSRAEQITRESGQA
jgi:hypothetical protein